MSLQTKVLAAFLAIALLVTLVLSGIVSALLANLFSHYLEATLSTRLTGLKSTLEEHFEAKGSFQGAEVYMLGRSMMMGGYGYIVADSEAIVVVGPGSLIGQKLTKAEVSKGIFLLARGKRVGTLIANSMMGHMYDLAPLEHDFRRSFYQGVVATGALVLLLSLGIGIIISRRLVAPLRVIDKAASTLAAGELSYRLPEKYSEGELNNLVKSFNEMASQLEQNERSRRNLVADVAHELRTPITIVRVALESMLDGVAKPDEAQLASLYDEVSRMGRLIADLQDLSLAEAGKLKLSLVELDLESFLVKLIDHIRPIAEDKGLIFTLTVAEPMTVTADKDRLAQVLFNVVSNALQHSQKESVVSVTAMLSEEHVRVGVTDSGPGIAREELPYVFDRFYRGDKSRHREGGTGLGLAISKEFVQAMGGRIEVTSVLGHGTTFTVCIPAKPIIPPGLRASGNDVTHS
ncbi:MAG: sensor histidine kinase [Bacillota bacterium]|nr:MAG: sensor histidine kinase [Bacillota bacterium]